MTWIFSGIGTLLHEIWVGGSFLIVLLGSKYFNPPSTKYFKYHLYWRRLLFNFFGERKVIETNGTFQGKGLIEILINWLPRRLRLWFLLWKKWRDILLGRNVHFFRNLVCFFYFFKLRFPSDSGRDAYSEVRNWKVESLGIFVLGYEGWFRLQSNLWDVLYSSEAVWCTEVGQTFVDRKEI